jgi:glycerophosphoryl diester phosphodiesterase
MTEFSLVAHRGYPKLFPDNSLVGIRAVLDAGARYLEVDVQMSTDGTVYLFHDEDLQRVAGCAGQLTELSDERIAELRASETARLGGEFSEEPIAKLSELAAELQRRPEVFTFVEIKPIAVQRFGASRVVESVLADLRGLEERVAIISFDFDALFETRTRNASLPVALILERWSQLEQPEAARLAPEFVFSNTRHLPKTDTISMPAVPDARLVVYEVTDPVIASDAAARGAEFVETFHYPEMRAALAGSAS